MHLDTTYTKVECRFWPYCIVLQYIPMLCEITYSQYPVFSEDSAVFHPCDSLTCPTNGVEDHKGLEKA